MTLKWEERYNCHTAHIAYGLTLNVNWDSVRSKDSRETGFKVFACGVELKGLSQDLNEGKKRAIKAAQQILTKALAILSE